MGMTCNDCIYRAMCYNHEHYGRDDEETCEMFKNKADFVEVVRCKDCKWWMPFKANVYCRGCCKNNENGLFEFSKPDDFCSYGERGAEE